MTAGYVGADLAALHRHAALLALGRGDGVNVNGGEETEEDAVVRDAPSEVHPRSVGDLSERIDAAAEIINATEGPASPPHRVETGEAPPHSPSAADSISTNLAQLSISTTPDASAAAATGAAAPSAADGRPQLAIRWSDLRAALHLVRPSALREVELRVPTTSWDDIGGQVSCVPPHLRRLTAASPSHLASCALPVSSDLASGRSRPHLHRISPSWWASRPHLHRISPSWLADGA